MTITPQTPDAPRDEQVARLARLARLIADTRVCMFTTIDDGRPMSRPMAVQEVEFDGDLWFFTRSGGRKVEQIGRNARVAVSFASRSSWVSVTGEAEVVRDLAKGRELWNAGISAWFPDGPDDPDLVLLKVHADGAEYWDGPGQGIVTVLSFIKAHVTGRPYRIDDVKVDL